MTLSVEINRVGSETTEPGAGFADDTFSVEVEEDTPPRSFLKRLSVIGARQTDDETPVTCRIQKGNELGELDNFPDSKKCHDCSIHFMAQKCYVYKNLFIHLNFIKTE